MKNVYLQLVDELETDKSLVLGTLVKTKGSTPQVPGASAIFNANGLLYGTLGGGIMEAETLKRAKKSIQNGENVFEEFSLNADINDESGAICGGTATFLLDANPADSLPVFRQIKKSLDSRISGVLITVIETSDINSCALTRYWVEENAGPIGYFQEKYGISGDEISRILNERNSRIIKTEQGKFHIYIEPVYPLPELVIVGAGHIGQALCHLGSLTGFDVTVLDSRADLATRVRFPDAYRIINEEISKGFEKIKISGNTFIVLVTQGHRDDAVALKCCIKSNAAYIGMIGSKRKTTLMCEKFIQDGDATELELDKIYAPVGIDIHSKTVQEIAISISAQLIKVRYLNQHKKQEPIVHCVVLAAGESKRMKQQKMLLPFGQKSIIETVIENAKKSKAKETWVVLGSDKEIIENQINYLEISIAENVNYKEGMLSSVICGINAIPQNADAVIVLLGDQPMVEPEIINRIMESYRTNRAGIVIPTYDGKRGHPVLIDLKYRKEINNLNPEIGLRELMLNHAEDIMEISVKKEYILNDIDTPEDYSKESTKPI